MNILFLGLHRSRNSGVSKVQIELSEELKSQGHTVDELSALTIPGHDFTSDDGTVSHFNTLDCFIYNNLDKNYDVIHSHSWAWAPSEMKESGGLSLVKDKYKAPIVHTFHSFKEDELNAQRSVISLTDCVTLLNNTTIPSYSDNFEDQGVPFEVIPNMVKTQRVSESDKVNLRQKYNLNDKKLILYVGRIEEGKGVVPLAYAFTKLYSYDSSYVIIFIGSGQPGIVDYLMRILGKHIYSGNAFFTGWISEKEVACFQSIGDLEIAPSYTEAFLLTAAKGIMNGCVQAISNIPTLQEIFDLNTSKPCAIPISNVGDKDAIVDVVQDYFSNPEKYRQTVKNGQVLFSKKYAPKIVTTQYLELYNRVRKV